MKKLQTFCEDHLQIYAGKIALGKGQIEVFI